MEVTQRSLGRDYALLFREIGPQLWRSVVAYAGGRSDIADDAVSEAFARAIANDSNIRDPYPWLYRTAFRLAATELRRAPEAHDIDAPYEQTVVSVDLLSALRRLRPSQRAAVYLHYQADLPVREVARLMGSSSSAVRVQLHRGRRRLRELLSEEEEP